MSKENVQSNAAKLRRNAGICLSAKQRRAQGAGSGDMTFASDPDRPKRSQSRSRPERIGVGLTVTVPLNCEKATLDSEPVVTQKNEPVSLSTY